MFWDRRDLQNHCAWQKLRFRRKSSCVCVCTCHWEWKCACCETSDAAWEVFVSHGLTLKSPHSDSCTTMHCLVLCAHSAQQQGELILVHISGEICGFWGMDCNKCIHHTVCTPSTPGSVLGAGRSMPSGKDWLGWSKQTQHKWGLGSVTASPVQVMAPAAAHGTGHLGTQRIITVSHMKSQFHGPMWDTGSLTLGNCHQDHEKTQQSHLLNHRSAFPRILSSVWGEICEIPQAYGTI
jgi:hypothetical protein